MLHTLHDFRRRGYAALVVRALASKIIQDGALPFCHIVEGNTSSLALFRSLGFEEPQPEERFDWYVPSQVPFPLRLIVTLWSGTISAGKLIDVSPPFAPPPPSAALRSMRLVVRELQTKIQREIGIYSALKNCFQKHLFSQR